MALEGEDSLLLGVVYRDASEVGTLQTTGGDFDGNGASDLVISNPTAGTVRVFYDISAYHRTEIARRSPCGVTAEVPTDINSRRAETVTSSTATTAKSQAPAGDGPWNLGSLSSTPYLDLDKPTAFRI